MKEGRKKILEFVKDFKEIKFLGSILKFVSYYKEIRILSFLYGVISLDYLLGSVSLRRSRILEDFFNVRYLLDLILGSGGFRRIRVVENRILILEGRRLGFLVSVDVLGRLDIVVIVLLYCFLM